MTQKVVAAPINVTGSKMLLCALFFINPSYLYLLLKLIRITVGIETSRKEGSIIKHLNNKIMDAKNIH
jgi:hypothetical protein